MQLLASANAEAFFNVSLIKYEGNKYKYNDVSNDDVHVRAN